MTADRACEREDERNTYARRGNGLHYPYLSRLSLAQTRATTLSGSMQNEIHPDYKFITVRLADGSEYTTRSTMDKDTYASEVDSSNHPFYTGKRTMVDTAGRVEKFRRRYGNEQAKQAVAAEAEEEAGADETAEA